VEKVPLGARRRSKAESKESVGRDRNRKRWKIERCVREKTCKHGEFVGGAFGPQFKPRFRFSGQDFSLDQHDQNADPSAEFMTLGGLGVYVSVPRLYQQDPHTFAPFHIHFSSKTNCQMFVYFSRFA
jgi:hypothetical protein